MIYDKRKQSSNIDGEAVWLCRSKDFVGTCRLISMASCVTTDSPKISYCGHKRLRDCTAGMRAVIELLGPSDLIESADERRSLESIDTVLSLFTMLASHV